METLVAVKGKRDCGGERKQKPMAGWTVENH
jgi:hypothetical protein